MGYDSLKNNIRSVGSYDINLKLYFKIFFYHSHINPFISFCTSYKISNKPLAAKVTFNIL